MWDAPLCTVTEQSVSQFTVRLTESEAREAEALSEMDGVLVPQSLLLHSLCSQQLKQNVQEEGELASAILDAGAPA